MVGQQGAAHHKGDGTRFGPVAAGGARHLVPFERLLPVVVVVVLLVDQEGVELPLHPARQFGHAGHGVQRAAQVRLQRGAQHAFGAGVGAEQAQLAIERHHAGGEVVEDGLQVGARAIDLGHAVLHRLARVGQLLRHVREGAGQASQFVLGGQG